MHERHEINETQTDGPAVRPYLSDPSVFVNFVCFVGKSGCIALFASQPVFRRCRRTAAMMMVPVSISRLDSPTALMLRIFSR